MCVFNDKIIAARDLNAFKLSGDAKSIHLHALRLESYLCSARFECFEPRFRANKAEISEKKSCVVGQSTAFSSTGTFAALSESESWPSTPAALFA